MNSWSCSIASRSLMHAITVVFLALTATVTCSAGDQRATTASAAAGAKQTKQSVSASYGKLPLSFEANDGQTDSSVRFLSRSRDFSLFLTSNEAVLSLRENRGVRQGRKQNSTTVLRMRLLGANPSPEIEGLDKLASVTNYLVGSNPKQWRTHVPNYAGVKYRSLYPGVDVVFHGSRRELEYDFLVAAGSDPRLIRLRIDGANKTFVDSGGDLVLHTRGGDVRLHKPIAYQEVDGLKRLISAAYVLRNKHEAAFRVGAYDRTKPLIIDPVLSYSTYLGGSVDDTGMSIAVDAAGSAYVTGETVSLNFPISAGAFRTSHALADDDAFVTKLSPDGTAFVYSTYLGGNLGVDQGLGIAVDSEGSAYVTGYTASSDFPVTAGAFQTTNHGQDAFITKLRADGSGLVFSTFLGGTGWDMARGIALGFDGSVYVTGYTESASSFPTTSGAYQTIYGGGTYDAFITKVNNAGTGLVYSTFLGGPGMDSGLGIAVDSLGSAYVAGWAAAGFPTSPGAYQTVYAGGSSDGFVTRLKGDGTELIYSTYLGGTSSDGATAIAIDTGGSAYVTGLTSSTDSPVLAPYQGVYGGGDNDGFVAKFNPTGALVYSTYLGGAAADGGRAIAVDSGGSVYLTGYTYSSDFPITSSAAQPSYAGASDAFEAKLNAGGTLVYSSFVGGEGADDAHGIAVDADGSAYVTGYTSSAHFPISADAAQTVYGGARDVFVVKVSPILPSLVITANNLTTTYGSMPVPTYTKNPDLDLDTPPTCVTSTTLETGIGTYNNVLTCSGASKAGYEIMYVPGTLTVIKATVIVTPDDQSMTYGGPIPTLTAHYYGFIGSDTAAVLTVAPVFSTAATITSATGTYAINVQNVPQADNYNFALSAGTMTVIPAVLTLIADSKSMGVGSKVPLLTASYFGFVNGESTAVLGNNPVLHTDATPDSVPGTYDITISPGSLTSPNYTFNFVPGKLTINPDALNFFNNFFVTGDYAAGSTNLPGGAGSITMGDIPIGAQFVAAFLYWQTLEQPASSAAGIIQFRNYPVLGGQQLGSDLPFTHAGATGVVRTYRANVLPYLPVTGSGISNAMVSVNMPSGWVNASRHAIGATLVVVYRVLSNERDSGTGRFVFPLKAVVIYDGSWAAPGPGIDMYQAMRGLYDTPTDVAVTVVTNDTVNWTQGDPENPMISGDTVSVDISSVAAAGLIVMSTEVNADDDGLLVAWKNQHGYYDARDGTSWIDLPGATVGDRDVFVQIDYMCGKVLADGTCDPTGHSHMPSSATLQSVAEAFEDHGINVHFDIGNNYQGQPHIVPSQFARGGNIIPEEACTDSPVANPPGCVVPNEAGLIGWKLGLGLTKMAPRDSNACANGGDCSPRFAHGRKDSYHYVLFGHSVVVPAWSFSNGYLTSISLSGNTATITTSVPHGLQKSTAPRITIAEGISQPYLNGIYVPTILDDYTFQIQTSNVSGSIDKGTDPGLSIYSGRSGSVSGFSDVGGADSVISLGNWKFCLNGSFVTNQCPENSPQNDSIRLNVEAGSFMHELGHSIGLTHGGLYYDSPNYFGTYEANCKPNYQSVMNYLFQIDLLGPGHNVLDYSDRAVDPIGETNAGNNSSWSPMYSWTSWYSPDWAFPGQTAAQMHCDGTPQAPDEVMYRSEGSALTWTANQDLNFNGKHDDVLRGYVDWDNLNLLQIGATGSHFVSGGVLLPNGGGVVLPNGGGVLLPNGGGVLRPDGGVILPNGGGVLLPNGGGVVLPNGGGVLLPDGGVVLPNGGGVLLPNGGGVVLPNGGGTVWSGATDITLPNGGGVLLANGGGVVLPNGGGVVLPNGGGVVLPNGGGVVLPNGGGVLLANGGGVLLPNGGGVLLPNGGGVVLPNGGGVVLPNGGGTLLSDGRLQLPGGGVLLANGGGVVLPNGGGVLLPNGGGALLANGGGVVLPNGGGATLPNGGGVTLPNGGGVLLPNGGGAEMTYEAANSFVRPPISATKTQTGSDITITWTAPNFGVVAEYAIYAGGSLVQQVTGNPPPTSWTFSGDINGTYLVTTKIPDEHGVLRESAPAVVKLPATVALAMAGQAYTGSPLFPAVTTTPPNLNVVFSGAPRTGAGSYSVLATIDNPTYTGSIEGTFVITQASSTVTLSCPAIVAYDGAAQTPCSASVTGAGGLSQSLSVTYSNNIGPGTATAGASFAGDSNHTPSSSSATFAIGQVQVSTTTLLVATPNPAKFGESVSLRSTVTPTSSGSDIPTGSITFRDGGTILSTTSLNNSAAATFAVSSLTPGKHDLTALYSGDTKFQPSSSAVVTEQIACGLLLSISPSSVEAGGRITVTASVVSCSTVAQKVVVQFSMNGPLQPNRCSRTNSVIFKTPPFILPARTSNTVSFPFPVLKRTCPGDYSISASTLVGGAVVNTSTASLTVTSR